MQEAIIVILEPKLITPTVNDFVLTIVEFWSYRLHDIVTKTRWQVIFDYMYKL